MKRVRRFIHILLAAVLLMGLCAQTAFASSTISSISIRVRVRLEDGMDLSDVSIDTGSDLDSSSYGCSVTTTSSKYYVEDAEFDHSGTIKVGSTPKIKVTLVATDEDTHYFKGSYGSSSISINGGSYVSSTRRSKSKLVIVLRANPVKGTYEAPDEAYWRDSPIGRATWSGVSDSSHAYDVYLYRGSTVVKKVERLKANTYNFYPYMTQKGTYTFKVRTVPYTESEQEAGKKSEWTESDQYYLSAEYVSDGSGQNNGNGGNGSGVGWVQSGGKWYFYYPNGTQIKKTWSQIAGKWYYFDTNGCMLTGWQTINGHEYYLAGTGEMLTGWQQIGNAWYYFNPTPDSTEGMLLRNSWVAFQNNRYYVNRDGRMVTGWYEISGATYYFYQDGHLAVNTWIDGFYVDANGVWRQ